MKNDINIETVSKNLLSVLCPQSTVSQSVCGKIVTLCVKDMSQIPSLGSLVICSTDISNLKTANYHISKVLSVRLSGVKPEILLWCVFNNLISFWQRFLTLY